MRPAIAGSEPPAALCGRGLSKSFGGVKAVDDVSLVVAEGEAVGIIGPNGAGKTSLFNLLAGTLPPDAGSVSVGGQDVTRWSASRRSRAGLARTFQITLPFQDLSVIENVMIGSLVRRRPVREAMDEALRCIDLVGLSQKADALASELSTGQRKRLELARAIATRPKILLLDEITGGIDHASIPGIVEVVQRIRETGVALLTIEHNMVVVRALAQRLVFMHRGSVLADGPVDEVASRHDVRSLYLGESDAPA